MDIKVKLGYIFVDLILPLTFGYFLRYQNRFGDVYFKKLMSLNILVFVPVLSTLSGWVLKLNLELLWLPIFGLLIGIVPGVTAYYWSAGKYDDYLEKGSYLVSASLSNLGTIGGLCAFIILGEIGYAYTRLAVLLQDAGLFLVCFPLAQYYYQKSLHGKSKAIEMKNLFWNRNQLPVAGVFTGAALYYSGIPRPLWMGELLDPLVHLAAWTALMPIGFSMDLKEMRQYYRKILDLLPIKFIVNPVLAYILAKMLIHDQTVIDTILILSATPTAINAVITAKLHSLNVNVAMAAFVVTTTVFLLVVFPALAFLLT